LPVLKLLHRGIRQMPRKRGKNGRLHQLSKRLYHLSKRVSQHICIRKRNKHASVVPWDQYRSPSLNSPKSTRLVKRSTSSRLHETMFVRHSANVADATATPARTSKIRATQSVTVKPKQMTVSVVSRVNYAFDQKKLESLPYNKRGVNYLVFDMLIGRLNLQENVQIKKFVQDCDILTQKRATALVSTSLLHENIASDGTELVSEATFFVSHEWDVSFVEVATILKAKAQKFRPEKPHTVYFWSDALAMKQHHPIHLDQFEELDAAIHKAGRMLLLISDWRNPTPLKRAWCLYEMLVAIECKARIELVLPARQQEDLVKELKRDYTAVARTMFRAVRTRDSDAILEADRYMIHRKIQQKLGCGTEVEHVCHRLGLNITDNDPHIVHRYESKLSWMERRCDNYYLKCSRTGVLDGKEYRWDHKQQRVFVKQLSTRGAAELLYDLKQAFKVLESKIKQELDQVLARIEVRSQGTLRTEESVILKAI